MLCYWLAVRSQSNGDPPVRNVHYCTLMAALAESKVVPGINVMGYAWGGSNVRKCPLTYVNASIWTRDCGRRGEGGRKQMYECGH